MGSPQERLQNKIVLFRGSGQGFPQERLQHKLVIPRKCLSEALAGGSPQERLQNKILITRKSSRATFLLPGNAFQRLWPRGPPGKAPEENCFYQEMHSRGSGGGARPGNSSRTRLLLLGNAFQRPGQGVPPGTALEQDRSYQEMPSRGFGQGVPQERL